MLLRAAFSAHSCTPCTHTTVQPHRSNVIVKFADDTTVVGLITDNDETAYREKGHALTHWCQENHLSLNINKTKELVVDFRRQKREHTPIIIDGTPVDRVSSFKFLRVHITEDLTRSAHTDVVPKKAQQRLFFLRRLNESPHPPIILHLHCGKHPDRLHHCLVWKQHQQQSQSSAKGCANCPLGGELPSLHDIYTRRRGKPGGSSVTPATQAMDCSLCCPQADSYAVYEHAQAD